MSRPARSILVRRDELLRLFEEINRGGQTILMVTHSVKAASHASRVLFIKDGEVFHEIYRGESTDEQLYQKISDTLTMLATAVSAMRNLYPRLAATNLKKNRRFYLPYLLACIVIVALFCIILTLASDPYLGQMQHGGSVSQVLGFGVSIMALFSAIILFYTNSTFTKQRKREFAHLQHPRHGKAPHLLRALLGVAVYGGHGAVFRPRGGGCVLQAPGSSCSCGSSAGRPRSG